MKTLLTATAVFVTLAMPAKAGINDTFYQMMSDTGCKSRFSDEKKADLYAAKYRGKRMTVKGEIEVIKGDHIDLKVLPDTFTFDIQIKMRDPKLTYDLEKGELVTVSFDVSYQGGCFLSFSGENGVLGFDPASAFSSDVPDNRKAPSIVGTATIPRKW
jgi:hypothetical protein